MSNFLKFIDRVPTYPNRKKITHSDSSVEYETIEYADEPITTGTPLNRNGFHLMLDSIMGYNELTATQETWTGIIEESGIVTQSKIGATNSEWHQRTGTGSITLNSGDIITYSLVATFSKQYYVGPQASFNQNSNGGWAIDWQPNGESGSHYLGVVLTLNKPISIQFTDNNQFVTLKDTSGNIVDGSEVNVKTIEFAFEGTRSAFRIGIYNFDFNNIKISKTIKTDAYTCEYDVLTNNQILYVNSKTSTIGSERATLNDTQIDTMLINNKYYELIYNEAQNKFIAEEVRNAN